MRLGADLENRVETPRRNRSLCGRHERHHDAGIQIVQHIGLHVEQVGDLVAREKQLGTNSTEAKAELAGIMQRDSKKWGEIVKSAGIEPH